MGRFKLFRKRIRKLMRRARYRLSLKWSLLASAPFDEMGRFKLRKLMRRARQRLRLKWSLLARWLLPLFPEVEAPTKRVIFGEKLKYTSVSLFFFLLCSQYPLYGVHSTAMGLDPFYRMRAILASSRGTLMELGITPIVTARLVMQLLAAAKLIKADKSPKNRALQNGTQKLLAILITVAQATAYVMSGMYGNVHDLGTGNAILVVIQLIFAGLTLIYLDELLQKGYGLGSGISLFVGTNICENIVRKTISPNTINTGRGLEFEGAVVAFFHLMITRTNKVHALKEAFYRQHLPNMTNLVATILVFLIVIYVQGFRVQLQVQRKKQANRNQVGTYPLKLFYTSSMPIILHSVVVSNLYFISQLLYKTCGGFSMVQLLGVWSESGYLQGGQLMPVGGLAYYITAPARFGAIMADPLHALFYVAFTMGGCALFSKSWIQWSGSSTKEVAKQLKENDLVIYGRRDSTCEKELNRYINPTIAVFEGLCVGALVIFADSMGAMGSGAGILLAVSTLCQYFENFEKERATKRGFSCFGKDLS